MDKHKKYLVWKIKNITYIKNNLVYHKFLMKTFYFKENDNIYKIFQVLDKLPKKFKEVIFSIDSKNDFFKNRWWLKLVLEKAQEKWVKVIFLIENQRQEQLLKSFWINYIWKKIPLHIKIIKNIKEFLDIFQSEHSFYTKHHNIFKLFILFIEIWLVFFSIYFIYNLVTPKTEVYIQPAVKIKHLVQRFYIYPENSKKDYNIEKREYFTYKKMEFTKTYTLKIPVSDISYLAKPSHGTIQFVNTTYKWISLKSNTLLTTKDGILFRIKNWVYIPPKNWKWKNWTAKVKVVAEQKDKQWNLIWVRWNLLRWQNLYISKMYLSIWRKLIYAKVFNDFQGWSTDTKWVVQLKDIQLLKQNLRNTMEKDIKSSILKYIQFDESKKIPLLQDKLFWVKDLKYHIYANPWDEIAYLKWDISWIIYFYYISKKDIKNAFKKYLNSHIVSKKEFLWWDDNSIELLEVKMIKKWFYLISISINALLWYDFQKDYNNILTKINNQIKWKDIKEAKDIILWYSAVAWVDIKTTDSLNKVSNLNSRIFIHITK